MLFRAARAIPSTILDLIHQVDGALAQGSVEAARDAALESRIRRRMWSALVDARAKGDSAFVSSQTVGGRVSQSGLGG